jgi:hypothetical protein
VQDCCNCGVFGARSCVQRGLPVDVARILRVASK